MNKKILCIFLILAILPIFIIACHRSEAMEESDFESNRIIKTASITINGNIDDVFPLFGPYGEQKWASHWSPEGIYPTGKKDEKNMIFKVQNTAGHGDSDIVSYWVVSEYSEEQNKIVYVTFSGHDITTIDIQCTPVSSDKTQVDVQYIFTSLDNRGDELITSLSERIFSQNLLDWQKHINIYLDGLK